MPGRDLQRILVTGSQGLIGSALALELQAAGHDVVGFDIASMDPGRVSDITSAPAISEASRACTGIVHLAAISRVRWAEHNPVLCHNVNVLGTQNVLRAASESKLRPWVLVASSREVYGNASKVPVKESHVPGPVNSYARSKLAAERLVESSRRAGLRTSVIRFANVYGSITDHRNRVAPAFARLAAEGVSLHVHGREVTLDFTYLADVVQAVCRATDVLAARKETLPTLHLASGRGTTLLELANIAIRTAGAGSIVVSAPRPHEVSSFIGDPGRAYRVLGWRATTTIEEGMRRLVGAFATSKRNDNTACPDEAQRPGSGQRRGGGPARGRRAAQADAIGTRQRHRPYKARTIT